MLVNPRAQQEYQIHLKKKKKRDALLDISRDQSREKRLAVKQNI